MRKTLSIVLVLLVCFLLFACKKETEINKADMATAPFLDLDTYKAEREEDPEQAAKEYEGQFYRYTGTVIKVNAGYCVIGYEQFNVYLDCHETHYVLKIFLDKDELSKLEIGTEYTFAGRLEAGKDYPILQDAFLIEE